MVNIRNDIMDQLYNLDDYLQEIEKKLSILLGNENVSLFYEEIDYLDQLVSICKEYIHLMKYQTNNDILDDLQNQVNKFYKDYPI